MLALDIIRQVQRRFGDASGMFLADSDILDWITECQLDMAQESTYFTQTVNITVATYLAENGLEIGDSIVVKYVKFGHRLLDYKDYRLILGEWVRDDATGQPQNWYRYTAGRDESDPAHVLKQLLRVYPAPDPTLTDSFEIGVAAVPSRLVTTSDPVDAPESYHAAIVDFCVMRAHERNRDWQAMKIAQENYVNGLAQRRYEGQQIDESWPVMQDVLGDW